MHRFALNFPVNVEELRERLRRMSEEQLLRFGRAAQPAKRDNSPTNEEIFDLAAYRVRTTLRCLGRFQVEGAC